MRLNRWKLIFKVLKLKDVFAPGRKLEMILLLYQSCIKGFNWPRITLALVCNQLRLDTFSIFLEALSVSCILDLIMCILNHQSDDLTCFTHYLSLAIFVAIYTLLGRDDICHKYYKQRLCKIITTRVKFHFVDML